MAKYTNVENKITKENPFDLLDQFPLVDENGKITEFYKIKPRSKALEKLSLKDFVNDGIEYIKKETKDKNESGNYAQIGSSGNSAQIGSSGYSAQIGSSGNSAKIGSSGYSAKIGSSGDSAQIGSSGDSAQIDIQGSDSIGFACGYQSRIKAKNGTWISLAEYEKNKKGILIPSFAKSAQIGNKEYVDAFGKVLNENNFYMLINKEFVPVMEVDGDIMVVFNKKKLGEFEIYKTQYAIHYKEKKDTIQFVAMRGKFTAHGESIKEAISDVEFKYLQSQDVKEHIERVTKQGFITPNDYRLLTGACRYGTNKWLEENGFTWEDSKTINEVIELTKGQYGHERLVKLLKK